MTNVVYETSTASILTKGENLEGFPLRSGPKQKFSVLHTTLDILAKAIRQEKEKDI